MTDIIKAEFAKFSAGATEKKITLALGELNKSDMRFGSKEVTSLTGATEAMQPTLSVTKKPKAYTLSIEARPRSSTRRARRSTRPDSWSRPPARPTARSRR